MGHNYIGCAAHWWCAYVYTPMHKCMEEWMHMFAHRTNIPKRQPTYIVMPHIDMADIDIADIVMAFIGMA